MTTETIETTETVDDARPTLDEYLSDNPLIPSRITNCRWEPTDDGKRRALPKSLREIIDDIIAVTDGWPARVGGDLFTVHAGTGLHWIDTPDALSAWLGLSTGVPCFWATGAGFHRPGEILAGLRTEAERYDSVATLPHVPPLAGAYYTCELPEAATAEDLAAVETLLDMFAPASCADRSLILSLFLTPLWGGPGGARPMFAIAAADRGHGKTALAEAVATLYGGRFDVRPGEHSDTLRARLLTPSARTKRLVLLDNIKSNRLSWADLEAMITCREISGRSNNVGERVRPNNLTWIMTVNGPSLATDMAQRAAIIELARPTYDPTWQARMTALLTEQREAMLRGLADWLAREPDPAAIEGASCSRWALWDAAILSRLPHAVEARRLIAARQRTADAEADETDLIVEAFRLELGQSARQSVRIPRERMVDPVREALRDPRLSAVDVGRMIGRIAAAGRTPIRAGTSRRWWGWRPC